MREIKLKLWDKAAKRMSLPFLPLSPVIQWADGDIDMPAGFACGDNERFDLVEFTGLKDKNGKEIYEGDIVRKWWGIFKRKHEYRNHQITLQTGSVGPSHGENVMSWSLTDCANLWNGEDVEVIGNIYEHSELLEE